MHTLLNALQMRLMRYVFTYRTASLAMHRRLYTVKTKDIHDVVILGASRTPIGSFQKSLAACSAPTLGSFAIRGALQNSKIDPASVQECFMGLVVSGGTKQAPVKQAALMGGLSLSTPCTAVNKICSSGMKAIMLAAQTISLGHQTIVCAGGMESMSNAPFYLLRQMPTYGGTQLIDSVVFDGLTDAKYGIHMGRCCEKTVSDLKITREEQDAYAKLSYERSRAAANEGIFRAEITPVEVPNKKSASGFDLVSEDEEYKRVDFQKFASLRPAFVPAESGGTITAANASTLNDGAAAAILASASYAAKDQTLKPIARIVAYVDAATDTIDFPVAPHLAVEKLLNLTQVNREDIAMWEINEAFAAVAIANIRLLGLDAQKVNVHGGAVSCGHPIGMSGARITNHLAMQLKPGEKGIAAICNGGGGASAIMLEGL